MKLQSSYALLDVKRGRRTLEHAVLKGKRVRVTIKGYIVQAGNDDGVSTEFVVDVTDVKTYR